MISEKTQPGSLAGIDSGGNGLPTAPSLSKHEEVNNKSEITNETGIPVINSMGREPIISRLKLSLREKWARKAELLSNHAKNRKCSMDHGIGIPMMKLLMVALILATIVLSILVVAQKSIDVSSRPTNAREDREKVNQVFLEPPPNNDPTIVYGRIIQPGTGRKPCFRLPCEQVGDITNKNEGHPNQEQSSLQAQDNQYVSSSLHNNNMEKIVYATVDTGVRKVAETTEAPSLPQTTTTTFQTTTTEETPPPTTATAIINLTSEKSNIKLISSNLEEQKENISQPIIIAPYPVQPDPNYIDNEIAITIDKIKGIEFPWGMMSRLRDNRRQSSSASSSGSNNNRLVKCSVNNYDRLIEQEIRNGNLSRPIVNSDGRFDNPFPTWRGQSVMDAIKFMMLEPNGPRGPRDQLDLDTYIPLLKPNFRANNQPGSGDFRITWIGHSTLLIQVDGYNILTDPVFSERASPVQYIGPKRIREPACDIKSLPKIDIVLISHNHYDHLDSNSVKELNDRFGDQCRWIVPFGLGEYLESMSVTNYAELKWWQKDCFYISNYNAIIKKELQSRPKVVTTRTSSLVLTKDQKERAMRKSKQELNIYFTPSQHWTRRGLTDVNKTLWGSFTIVSGNGATFFFTGDTAYCKAFKEIGAIFGPFTGAAIPIGAYSPRWFLKTVHVNPQEAVQIHRDIRSNRSVAIHHSTFILSKEHYLEPATLLRLESDNLNLKQPFTTIRHGESTEFCKAC